MDRHHWWSRKDGLETMAMPQRDGTIEAIKRRAADNEGVRPQFPPMKPQGPVPIRRRSADASWGGRVVERRACASLPVGSFAAPSGSVRPPLPFSGGL